jgi:outer membrane protein assembly factor BamE (lipoprotein component of BamABCDE complex)
MNKSIHAANAAIAVLLGLMLGACATKQGRDFDDAYAGQITPGETTKADIRNRLGPPAIASKAGTEDEWIYAYYQGGGLGATIKNWFGQSDPYNPLDQQQKRLIVTFQGDRVKQARFVQELPPPNPLEQAYR